MNETISILEMQAARSLAGVRDVIGAVKDIPGRKTVVVLSAGIPSGDRSGVRMYMRSDAVQAGKEAVEVKVNQRGASMRNRVMVVVPKGS